MTFADESYSSVASVVVTPHHANVAVCDPPLADPNFSIAVAKVAGLVVQLVPSYLDVVVCFVPGGDDPPKTILAV